MKDFFYHEMISRSMKYFDSRQGNGKNSENCPLFRHPGAYSPLIEPVAKGSIIPKILFAKQGAGELIIEDRDSPG
jgi:hypothetical protein